MALPYGMCYPVVQCGVEIPNRIFVGGLPYDTTELQLKEFFQPFGMVKDTKVVTDRKGLSKGYGFVTFETEEEADKVKHKGSLYLNQKKINVSKAIRKQGGQYSPRVNQEYAAGVFRPEGQVVYMDPNSHAEATKPIVSVLPPLIYPQQVPPQPMPVYVNLPMPGANRYHHTFSVASSFSSETTSRESYSPALEGTHHQQHLLRPPLLAHPPPYPSSPGYLPFATIPMFFSPEVPPLYEYSDNN